MQKSACLTVVHGLRTRLRGAAVGAGPQPGDRVGEARDRHERGAAPGRSAPRAPSGTSTRRKPRRAASRTRRSRRATRRTSPPSPISPQAATSAGSARSSRLDASASASAEIGAGLAPPARRPPRSRRRRGRRGRRRSRRSSTASSSASAPVVDAEAGAARGAVARRRDQRLELDQHRPRALEQRHDARARRAGAALGEEQLARDSRPPRGPRSPIGKTPTSWVEPKRFLLARSRRKAWLAVALEARAPRRPGARARAGRRAALLGDVADEDERGAVRLRRRREQRRALAHLRDRARRRLDAVGAQRLDRVDQHERGRASRHGSASASTRVSASTRTRAGISPRRSARSRTCSRLSSPVT